MVMGYIRRQKQSACREERDISREGQVQSEEVKDAEQKRRKDGSER